MISVFLPTRKGSERVINKNTRTFCAFQGGLLGLKLKQLLSCSIIDEVVLSTNDPSSIQIAKKIRSKKLKLIQRPEHLAQSSTSLVDLVKHASAVCSNEHILWTHVTSPFIFAIDYELIIKSYYSSLEKEYDSLMTVKALRSFIWDKKTNDIINRKNDERWPRTQDLKLFYEIDSAVFLYSKNGYDSHLDRIGKTPFLYELPFLKGFDIDWEEDFVLAESLFKAKYGDNESDHLGL